MERDDALQARILLELTNQSGLRFDQKRSYAKIASKLGVDDESVRLRVKRALHTGLISGWDLVLNPSLVGRQSTSVLLEVDDMRRKPAIINQLRLVQGVNFIFDYDGWSLRVSLYHRDIGERSRAVRLLGMISGCRNPVYWDEVFPPCNLKMKKTDWRIVNSLRRNPRLGIGDIARDIGASTRTVRRHVTVMADARAFNLLPLGNMKRSAGMTCQFFLHLEPSRKRDVDELVRRKLGFIVFANAWPGPRAGYAIFCRNIGEAEEIRDWISGLQGVSGVEMRVVKEIIRVPDWLDDEIGRQGDSPDQVVELVRQKRSSA